MATATTEPDSVRAGDTIAWQKTLSDFPASSGWTLKYRLINAAGSIDIVASASGADHLVSVSATTSATWQPGTYQYQSYVTKAAERYTVAIGSVEILPNLAAQVAGYDTRSTAKKTLEQLEAAHADYVSKGQGITQRYTIQDREIWFRSAADIIKLMNYYRNLVAQEEAAAAIKDGVKKLRTIQASF